jgi:iron complex transport system ATP-binding protein
VKILAAIAVALRSLIDVFHTDLEHDSIREVTPALALSDIHLRRDGVTLLDCVSISVHHDERWVLLGPNGSGKTSLTRVMALYEHPTSGTVEVLGERLGRTDVRELRRRVGYVSAALADELRDDLTAHDVVKTARYAALEPWWHRYTDADAERAEHCLRQFGVGHLAARRLGTLSSGERQRVLLARAVMNEPDVIVLDEPSARLDLGGREQLIGALADLAADEHAPPFVLVTHHVDEIPPGVSHAGLIVGGRLVASGPIEHVLTSRAISDCFDVEMTVERRPDGRWSAWSVLSSTRAVARDDDQLTRSSNASLP